MNIIEHNWNWARTLYARPETNDVIIHHAAASNATAEQIHAIHLNNGWSGIAYHFYVRKNGEIHRGRPENVQGGHTTDENYDSIGICFEGNFENEYMSDVQIKAGNELINYLRINYPKAKISKHKDWNATACPGKNFPFEAIIEIAEDEPSDWAKASWDKAVEKGIFDGTNPQGNFTREQASVVFDRLGLI